MRMVLFALLLAAACDDSSSVVKETRPVDAGATDAGSNEGGTDVDGSVDAGDCVMNPKTHAEIINACTDAVKIAKNPVLPKLLPDGGLPPLQ